MFDVCIAPATRRAASCSRSPTSASPSSATCCFKARSDVPTCPAATATLIRSIKDKLLPLGDDVAFICGHGPTSTIGDERQTNPFLQGDGLV